MKKHIQWLFVLVAAAVISCNASKNKTEAAAPNETNTVINTGQSGVKDDVSEKDVVKVAAASPDHTTLVAAVKQAELVDALSNAGPFTVFAPTNEAFSKLPAGTVEGLMKPDKKADLQNILQYHVSTSSLRTDLLKNMQSLGMVNGSKLAISVKDGRVVLNGDASIVASIKASNGMVHVIDKVLLPPSK
jgi:uncharacterized surface protein with fasciclin (FAS1) repeats